ncbi:MAG: hypothetical protein ACRYG7_13870 [Janthinobacterium lividum]
MLNGLFTRIGNLRDLGIPVTGSPPAVEAHQTFSAGAGVSYDFHAGAGATARTVATAKVKLTLSFSGGQGISINAYGLHHTRIQNHQPVSAAVLRLYGQQKWNARWVVVTDLYQAQRCLMAVSSEGAQEAEIEFEARQRVPLMELNLANAALNLVCKRHRNIGYTLDTQQGKVTLGLGFGTVHVPLVRTPRFEPFENRGRWGSDGPTTGFEAGQARNAGVYTPDAVAASTPLFVPVEVLRELS